MFNNGAALRKMRNSRDLSLKEVQEATGIANSKLSRVENNKDKIGLTIEEAFHMSELYKIGFLQFLIEAEFIHSDELKKYSADFSHIEYLSENDKAFIQQMINYIVIDNTKERNCNNEI